MVSLEIFVDKIPLVQYGNGVESNSNRNDYQSSKWRRLVHIIKKDRFKMEAVEVLSTSRSEYIVRKECI